MEKSLSITCLKMEHSLLIGRCDLNFLLPMATSSQQVGRISGESRACWLHELVLYRIVLCVETEGKFLGVLRWKKRLKTKVSEILGIYKYSS